MSSLSIIQQLKSTSSRLAKEKILKAAENDMSFRRLAKLALSEDINFYATSAAVPGAIGKGDGTFTLDHAFNVLDKFTTGSVRGNTARAILAEVVEQLTEEDAKLFISVLDKDLDCGAAAGTFNRVYGDDFIYLHPIMLAQKDEPKARAKIKFPAFYQVKYDGMRINIIVEEGKAIKYVSRNGKTVFINNSELDTEIVNLVSGFYQKEMVFDGELIFCDDPSKIALRETSNGIGNKAIKGTISQDEIKMAYVTLWDAIPLAEWKKRYYGMPYNIRYSELKHGLESLQSKRAIVAENETVRTMDEAIALYKKYVNMGLEGGMLKNIASPWEDARSHDQVKMKEVIEGDFLIVDVEEGKGKRKGKLGALVISSDPDDPDVVVASCGSGLKEEDLIDLEAARKLYVGQIVKTEYNKIIRDKRTKKRSFFLPIFKGIRHDKTVPDRV